MHDPVALLRAHSGDGTIGPAELQRALGLTDAWLAERVLVVLAGASSAAIDDVAAGLERLDTPEARLAFVFDLHDVDGDGRIDRDELTALLKGALRQARLRLATEQIHELVEAVLWTADTDRDGVISREELATAARQWPSIQEALSVPVLDWLTPAPSATERGEHNLTRRMANHRGTVAMVALFVAANLGFAAWTFVAAEGQWMEARAARAAGAMVLLHVAVLLIPILHTLWGKLRAAGLAVPPENVLVRVHSGLAVSLFVVSLVHAAGFYASRLVSPSGAVLLGILFAMGWTRRVDFDVFWWTHRLLYPWLALLVVHDPVAGYWAAPGIVLFAVDRGLSALRRSHTGIVASAHLVGSEVTRLVVKRPQGFSFLPGDAVRVQVPEISRAWRGFTIVSAPADRDLEIVHHATDDWARALQERLLDDPPPPTLKIDGPLGAPARRIADSRHVVIVAAGAGSAPFASVLRSLAALPAEEGPRSVHVFWLVRDQRALTWFADILHAIQDDPRFTIEVHLTAVEPDELTSATLHVALDLLADRTEVDLITGLHARTCHGHPDWSELAAIRESLKGERVDVYFSGPPALGREVREAALRVGFTFQRMGFWTPAT